MIGCILITSISELLPTIRALQHLCRIPFGHTLHYLFNFVDILSSLGLLPFHTSYEHQRSMSSQKQQQQQQQQHHLCGYSWKVRWVVSFLGLSLMVKVVVAKPWELGSSVDLQSLERSEQQHLPSHPHANYYARASIQRHNNSSTVASTTATATISKAVSVISSSSSATASSSRSRQVDIIRPSRVLARTSGTYFSTSKEDNSLSSSRSRATSYDLNANTTATTFEMADSPADWASDQDPQDSYSTPDIIICTLLAAFVAVLYRDVSRTCGNRGTVCVL